VSRYNRRSPHQPILPRLDTFQQAALAPFQSTVILAANPRGKGSGAHWKWRTKSGVYSIETGVPPAVPTPNYTDNVILAQRKGIQPKLMPRLVYPPAIVGPAPSPIAIPGFHGYFVKAVAGRRADVRRRMHVTRLRLTPAGGFVGAKLGFLTTTPTRQVKQFTVTPTRQANLTVQ
jgi:hypothetical protein